MNKTESMLVHKGYYGVRIVKMVPYICTVSGGGVRAIRCYRDAHTYLVDGKQVGYSLKEQTLLVTMGCSPKTAIKAFIAMGNFVFAPDIIKAYKIAVKKEEISST